MNAEPLGAKAEPGQTDEELQTLEEIGRAHV